MARPSLAPSDELHIRQDLQPFFNSQICEKKSITTKLFWEAGIFDAQIEGKVIPSAEMAKVNAAQFVKIAEEKTRGLKHLGWIGGKCPDGSAWIITTPASKNFVQYTAETIFVAHDEMTAFCPEIDIRFANSEKDAPERIETKAVPLKNGVMAIDTAKKARGLLSVSCVPKDGKGIANLWYLVPVKGGPLPDPPFIEALTQKNGLEQWINKLRKNEGLPELKILTKPDVRKITSELLEDESVKHNPVLLEKAEAELRKINLTTVGENRVKALSPKTMGWLLWNSPSHRDLILSKKANAVVTSSKKLGTETLATILFVTDGPVAKP